MTLGIDTSFWVSIVCLVLLLVLSGFLSSAETAFIATSRARIQNMAKGGHRVASLVATLQGMMGRVIASLLLLNTVTNVGISVLATSVLITLFGENGTLISTFLIAPLIVIYGEVTPKLIAFQQPEAVALRLARFVRWVVVSIFPASYAAEKVARFGLRLVGYTFSSERSFADSVEELRGAIELHQGPGPSVAQERAMLRSILDLDQVGLGEIMVHRKNVLMIDINRPYADILEHVLSAPYSRIPFWEDNPDNIIGVLHVKSLLKDMRRIQDISLTHLKTLLQKPWFVPETTTLLDQLQAFRERREHFAMVVDEYGVFLGIVTLEDVLEEIVGNIDDEHDIALPGVHMVTDGVYTVEGHVTVRDLNRQLDWNLSDDRASTLAGFVMFLARRIPDVGDTVAWGSYVFEIMKKQRYQLTLIKVTCRAQDRGQGD